MCVVRVEFIIKNKGTATLSLNASGFGSFYTSGLNGGLELVPGAAIHLISDGTNWMV